MVVMENCCCCKVKTACLIFGVLTLLGSISLIGKEGKAVLNYTGSSDDLVQAIYNQYRMEDGLHVTKEEIRKSINIEFAFSIANLILCILMAVGAGCLIYGVRSENHNFLLPAIVIWPLDMFVALIFILVYIIILGFSVISLIMIFVLACRIVFNIPIWFCFYSHWQQLKDQPQGRQLSSYNTAAKV